MVERGARQRREVNLRIWMREDEDMFNVALWRARANKSWCKFDNFPELFLSGYEMPADLYRDAKWYPDGIPAVFYSSHATKDFEFTDWLVTLLARCSGKASTGHGASPSVE